MEKESSKAYLLAIAGIVAVVGMTLYFMNLSRPAAVAPTVVVAPEAPVTGEALRLPAGVITTTAVPTLTKAALLSVVKQPTAGCTDTDGGDRPTVGGSTTGLILATGQIGTLSDECAYSGDLAIQTERFCGPAGGDINPSQIIVRTKQYTCQSCPSSTACQGVVSVILG